MRGNTLGTLVNARMLGAAVGVKVTGVGEKEVGDAAGAEVLRTNTVGE